MRAQLRDLKSIETHYDRKENVLFPHLEKVGFMGPSKVMWGKDNEVRDLLKAALAGTGRGRRRERRPGLRQPDRSARSWSRSTA